MKDEGWLLIGLFKVCGFVMVVLMVKVFGIKWIVMLINGNVGVVMVVYCVYVGIEVFVFVFDDMFEINLCEIVL